MEGGSGRASIDSPTNIHIENGNVTATIKWSSPFYDYMIVDGNKYELVNKEGNSMFEIPVDAFDTDITVIADTVAMSVPHEIEYTFNFKSESIQ